MDSRERLPLVHPIQRLKGRIFRGHDRPARTSIHCGGCGIQVRTTEEWPGSLVLATRWNVDFLEKAGQDLDSGDEDQVVKRSRVGDNNPHSASKAQAAQGRAFTLEIFHGVIQPNFMGLQEPVESVASLNPRS